MTKLPLTVKASSAVGSPSTPGCNGVYQGSVVSVSDPLQQGRVLLKVPQVLGSATSNWALPVGNSTVYATVTVGQMVHVWFLGGNRNLPVYVPVNWPFLNLVVPGTLTVQGTSTFNSLVTATAGLNTTTLNVTAGATITGGLTADLINAALSKFKTGNNSRTSTSLTNDSDLVNFPIAANAVYIVNGTLMTSGSATAFAYSFTVPAGATGTYAANQYSAGGNFQDFVSNSWTANNTSGNLANNSAVVFHGLLNNLGNASGTLTLQWGSGGGGTATLEADSFIKVERAQ